MNDAAVRPPRRPEDILREIDAAQHYLSALRELLGECAAFDVRPVLWDPETLTVTKLGDFTVPPALRDAYRDAYVALKTLEREFCDLRDPPAQTP